MKISKQELIEMGACPKGLDRFIEQTNNTEDSVDVVSLLGGENTYRDLLWLADKKLDKNKIVKFACDCALINIELIKPYTGKYDETVEFLENPFETNLAAAYAAVRAAQADYIAQAEYVAQATACVAYVTRAAVCAVRDVHDAQAEYVAYVARAADYAARVTKDSKDKVNALLARLFNE